MSRQDANAAFALSSFLQGTNAAYIDDLYARYEQDPNSVDGEWQEFFKSLKDSPADVKKNAEGASWGRDHWPLTPRDELTSALDGNWALVEKAVSTKLAAKAAAKGADISAADVHQATRDSVRALMAHNIRGVALDRGGKSVLLAHQVIHAQGHPAAGDIRSGSVKRVASAVGEGSMAVTFIHQYLSSL